MNQGKEEEVSMEDAVLSWFNTVYLPIVTSVRKCHILHKFPKRTLADMYVWIVRYWDSLKHTFGDDVPIDKAVQTFGKIYQIPFYKKIKNFFSRIILRKAISANSADNYIKLDD